MSKGVSSGERTETTLRPLKCPRTRQACIERNQGGNAVCQSTPDSREPLSLSSSRSPRLCLQPAACGASSATPTPAPASRGRPSATPTLTATPARRRASPAASTSSTPRPAPSPRSDRPRSRSARRATKHLTTAHTVLYDDNPGATLADLSTFWEVQSFDLTSTSRHDTAVSRPALAFPSAPPTTLTAIFT